VKRNWRRRAREDQPGFPSTASIASAPYRQAVLRRIKAGDGEAVRLVGALEQVARDARLTRGPHESPVAGLQELIPGKGETGYWLAVDGGPWVYPDRWAKESLRRESTIDDDQLTLLSKAGRKAARDLIEFMGKPALADERGSYLTSYLAVVVQDVDGMGAFLGGQEAANGTKIAVTEDEHRRVSGILGDLAARQPTALRTPGLLGVPVYSGGDDLLLFVPAATALRAAEVANAAIPQELPTASTAVLYFHYHASIQQAMSRARHLLDEGKRQLSPRKHALAVGYLRRSGASEESIQPWAAETTSAVDLFGVFTRDTEHQLSPRLAAELERDKVELRQLLTAHERFYVKELARLVARHTSERGRASADAASRAAEALTTLGRNEAAPDGTLSAHVAAKVGVFIRQEAR
jgi:CRISPR-associated protein Cmr2